MTLPIAAPHLVRASIFHESFFSVSGSSDRQSGPIDKELNLSVASVWAGRAIALPLKARQREEVKEGRLFVHKYEEVTNTLIL